MEYWAIIAERWPNQVLMLRKRSATDPVFREILSDYYEARKALDRWAQIDRSKSERVADYEMLVREIEVEIETRLT